MSHKEYSLFSPAKINLFLEILSKRNDGFHNLNSLMCFCNIGDKIKISKSESYSLNITGPFSDDLKSKNNIITDTLKKLEIFFNKKFSVSIVLEKNLPISSGMGGGSSNAATIVRAIINIFNLNIKKLDLDKLLISIGSDVPFCFYGKSSIVSGIGEKVVPLKHLEDLKVLLVNPLVEISTKSIFHQIKCFNTNPTNFPREKINRSKLIDILNQSKNDLQYIVTKKNTQVNDVIHFFKNETESSFYRMTGSGATCFGVFDTYSHMKKAEVKLKNKNNNWWIASAKTLNYI